MKLEDFKVFLREKKNRLDLTWSLLGPLSGIWVGELPVGILKAAVQNQYFMFCIY